MTADNLPPVALNYAVECLLAESFLKRAIGGFDFIPREAVAQQRQRRLTCSGVVVATVKHFQVSNPDAWINFARWPLAMAHVGTGSACIREWVKVPDTYYFSDFREKKLSVRRVAGSSHIGHLSRRVVTCEPCRVKPEFKRAEAWLSMIAPSIGVTTGLGVQFRDRLKAMQFATAARRNEAVKSPSNSDRVVECKDTGSTQPLVDKNHCGRMAQGLQANPATIILPTPSDQSLYGGDIVRDGAIRLITRRAGHSYCEPPINHRLPGHGRKLSSIGVLLPRGPRREATW